MSSFTVPASDCISANETACRFHGGLSMTKFMHTTGCKSAESDSEFDRLVQQL